MDEADKVLDENFEDDVNRILAMRGFPDISRAGGCIMHT